jgi:hypothetical protein
MPIFVTKQRSFQQKDTVSFATYSQQTKTLVGA